MKRIVLLTAIATALITFAISNDISRASKATRFVTVRPGSYITFSGLDLACSYDKVDPDHNEAGPVFYCGRPSVNFRSRSVGGSRYHFWTSNRTGNKIVFEVARTP